MNLSYRYLLWLLTGLLFTAALWYGGQEHLPSPKALAPEALSALDADMWFEDLLYRRNVSDGTKWLLKAGSAKLYEKRQLLKLKRVSVRFFQPNGATVQVVAEQGTYDFEKKELSLRGGVTVHSSEGRILRTQSLRFSQAKERIWTKDPVRLEGQGLQLTGAGLEYDLRSGKLVIQHQTAILPEDGELGLD